MQFDAVIAQNKDPDPRMIFLRTERSPLSDQRVGSDVTSDRCPSAPLSLADEQRLKREAFIATANSNLQDGPIESITKLLREIRDCFHQAPPFIGSIPDANIVNLKSILALVEDGDEQISREATSTAIWLLHFRDDHEHDLVEKLSSLLERGDVNCSLRAVAALNQCSIDASHSALPLVVELATSDNVELQAEICRFITAFGKGLIPVVRQLAIAIVQLENVEPRVELLRAMLWGLDRDGVPHTEVARMICPPLSKDLAISLLGRVGPFGRPIREFLLTSEIDFARPVSPLTVQRDPNRVFYPDRPSDPIELELAEFLTKLIEAFPDFVSLADLKLDSRKVTRMLTPHPILRRYIQSITGGGTRIRYRPLALEVQEDPT